MPLSNLGSYSNSSQRFLSYFPILWVAFVATFDPQSLSRAAWVGMGMDGEVVTESWDSYTQKPSHAHTSPEKVQHTALSPS